MTDTEKNDIIKMKAENFVDAQIAETIKRMTQYADSFNVSGDVKVKALQYMAMLMTECMSRALASACRTGVYDNENNLIDAHSRDLVIEDFETLLVSIRYSFMEVLDGQTEKQKLH